MDQARIDREGAIELFVRLLHRLVNIRRYAPNVLRKDFLVTRKWLGFESPPERFTIVILPPK